MLLSFSLPSEVVETEAREDPIQSQYLAICTGSHEGEKVLKHIYWMYHCDVRVYNDINRSCM